MGVGPCVFTKVMCAPCMGSAKFVVGWAMVGRAEFAYLIAQMAAAANMIDSKTFSICIWALLYATILAPFVFRYVLNNHIKDEGIQQGPSIKVDDDDYDGVFVIGEEETSERKGGESQAKKLDYDAAEGAVIGKTAEDLEASIDNIQLDIEEAKAKVAAKEAELPSPITAAKESAAAKESEEQKETAAVAAKVEAEVFDKKKQAINRLGRIWWGRPRQPATVENPNAFLCCLFFNRVNTAP